MNLYLIIIIEFIKIGLLAIGGGLATLPFLYHLSTNYGWFSPVDLTQMLAIANIIPGPVGINLASQAGFKAIGFWGALMAVIGIMIPSLIFVFIISKLLKEFEGNKFVRSIFYMLKPTSCAMIVAIGVKLLRNSIIKTETISLISIDWLALILFLTLVAISVKKAHSPLFYLSLSALIGIMIHIVKLFL